MGIVTDLLGQREKPEQKARLVAGVNSAEPTDQAGRVLSMQMKTGLPVDLIERNLDLVEQHVARKDFDVDKFRRESPVFAQWASENQHHLAAARDDVENLTGLEWVVQGFKSARRDQWRSIELGTLRSRQLAGQLSPEGEQRIAQLKSEITGGDFGAEDWYEKVVVETGRLLPTMEFAAKAGLERGLATGAGFAGIAALAGQAGPQVALPEELITVPTAAIMGMGMGSASGAAEAVYNLEAGLAYDEFLDMRDESGQPLDPGVARGAAAMVGLVNAGLESFGLAAVAKYIPGVSGLKATMGREAVKAALAKPTFRQAITRFAARYAEVMGTEVTTEVLQEATTILGGEIAGRLSSGEFQGLTAEQIGSRLAEIAVKTTQGMAVIGAAGPGMQFVQDARRVQRANENQAVFQALGEKSTDSKLRQRVPAKFREFVERLQAGGEVDTVSIPVERFAEYFQARELDPAEVAAELTGSQSAYTEAQASGTDIEIPLAAYAERIAPTEHHQALLEDLRLRPDDMTMREAREWQAKADEITASLASQMEDPTDASMPIFEDVLGQLLQARMERGAAEQNATLVASVFETLAARTGQDPLALYQKYGLRVQHEMPEVMRALQRIDVNIDPMIDRLRSGAAPSDREIYGPSLSDFLREKGGLRDQGGELSARDARQAIRGLVKSDGLTFDHAAELAQEAGYITERSDNALLDALDREIRGETVFRPDSLNQHLLDLRTALDDLGEFLSQEGVDISTATNDQIRELLQGTVFDQDGNPYIQRLRDGEVPVPAEGLSPEDKRGFGELHKRGYAVVEDRGGQQVIRLGRGLWYEDATTEQQAVLDKLESISTFGELDFKSASESLQTSASAFFTDYEVAPGIRSVSIEIIGPLLDGYDTPKESSRIAALADAIKESGEIEPIFVGIDPNGETYIMEGQHRVRALALLGYDSVPARVVVDMSGTELNQSDNILYQSSVPRSQLDMFASAAIEAAPQESPAAQPFRGQQGMDFDAEPDQTVEQDSEPATEGQTATEQAPGESQAEIVQSDTDGATGDAGEELWYNRRNQSKSISWSDVEGLNATLRAKEVTKQKIWPRPNYEKLVEDGLDPVAAHLIKQVYDSLASKPAVRGVPTDAQMRAYLEGVERLRDATFEYVRGLDMAAFSEKLEAAAGALHGGGYAWQQKAELNAAIGVVARERGPSSYPLTEALFPLPEPGNPRSRFRGGEQGETNNRLVFLMGGNKLLQHIGLDADSALAAAKAVAEGWPAPQEAWQKRFQIRETPAGSTVYEKGAKRTLTENEFFIVKKGGRFRQILATGFKSREEAIERAREMTKRETESGPKREEGINVDAVQRDGPARRPEGKDISTEQLIETFGFRGVNFGNWMKGKGNETERQAHLNYAYDAFTDLAALLNVPAKAMSLNGMLGLAFGAQGRGGKAAAHFVPGVNEINLTREKGAGSLAHEWGHALDHYFNNQISEQFSKTPDPFLTENVARQQPAASGLRPEILEAFRVIAKTMKERDETPEEMATRIERSRAEGVRRLDSWLAHFRKRLEATPEALGKFDAIAQELREGRLGDGYVQIGRDAMSALPKHVHDIRSLYKEVVGRVPPIDEIKGLSSNASHVSYLFSEESAQRLHKPMPVPSAYKRAASEIEGDSGGKAYWTTPWEMFARAFESYVLDRLEAQSIRNDYLVAPGKSEKVQGAMVRMGMQKVSPYPAGDERIQINASIDTLVSTLKYEETDKGFRLYQEFSEARRGSIQFSPSRQVRINLLTKADLSTFLHETGHLYLEVLGDLAEEAVPVEPPVKPGMTRLYHGSAEHGRYDGPAWFSSNREYAAQYRADAELQYVDMPTAWVNERLDPNGYGQTVDRGFTLNIELDSAESGKRQPLMQASQVVQDYAAILKWLGVESRQAISRDHHEQFARGFEAYLMEGKAPSVALQNAFARFKAWLVSIYRRLSALNVELTDEIRGVFDRLVATDEAIQAAEESQNYVPLFTDAETAGMSREEFAAYRATVERARVEAEESLSTKLLAVMLREQKKWWKDQRDAIRAEVAEEVHAMRVYKALSFLQYGKNPDGTDVEGLVPAKIAKSVLVDEYGYPQEFLKRLPGSGRSRVYTVEGGAHPDEIAALFGYPSGTALVQDLVNARPMRQLIEAEAEARLRERFPDPLTDGSLAEQAINVVHNDKRAELLAAELRALRRKQREVRPFVRAAEVAEARERREAREANKGMVPDRDELKLIRAAAQRIIGQRKVLDIKPAAYRAAESRAARKSFDAAARGDYQTAYVEKRKQLLNHELFRAAENGIEQAASIRDYFKKFSKRSVRERLGKAGNGLLEKIESILADFSLKQVSGKEIERADARRQLLSSIESGEIMAPPDTVELLKAGTAKNWRELTLDQMVGTRDVVRQLETQARALSEAVVNGERIQLKEAADGVAESILEHGKLVRVALGSRSPSDSIGKSAKQALLSILRPAEIARQLDGGKDFGPVLRTLIEPIRRAYAEKLIPAERKIREDVANLYRKHYSNAELGKFRKLVPLPEIGAPLSKGDLLSLALNWGNEGNRRAVLDSQFDGVNLVTEDGVNRALRRLDARDWAFVQDVWDYIDTYWQPIADLEKRRRGVAPAKVEAAPFTIETSDGETVSARGGYYPLKYDADKSDAQRSNDLEGEFERFIGIGNVSASTRAGSTHERVGSGRRAIRLGLNVIDQHLHEVVRDLALGEESRFVYRVLQSPEVRSAMAKTGNGEAREALLLWIKDAAVGEQAARGFLNRSSAFLRVGFTKAKLAWNMTTTVLQLTGFPQTMVVVGPNALGHGLAKYMASPVAMHRHIMESSAFMRARYRTNSWNKDVADTKAYLESYFGGVPTRASMVVNALSYSYFWPIARTQMVVDSVTWLAGYWKGVNERGLSDTDAALYADSVVENAQTSGFFSDRSGVERGTTDTLQQRQSQFVKLWTTLISYMLAKSNIAYAKGRQFMRNPSLWGATTFAADIVMLFTVEAILAAAIRGRLPDDDEDGYAEWLAKETAASMASGIPFVREIAAARYGSGNTPIGVFTNDIWKAMVQAEQGEIDPAMIKAFNNVGGTLFHYPSGQINKAVDAYWAEQVEGEDVALYEYVTGRKKE